MDRIKDNKIFNFLGLQFHNLTLKETIEQVERFIQSNTPHKVFTPTAELIVRANQDDGLKEIYNTTDILTVDSYVVYYAARLCGKTLKEPVSAARLMFDFLDVARRNNYKLYLLGATEEVSEATAENLKRDYPGINIVGRRNGYFDSNNDAAIVNEIRTKTPDVLLVAMSSPLKENFISRNIEKMNVPVSIGVGGSFDIIAGKCKLAPAWISKMGLEWFYRMVQEPRRLWKRYLITNAMFLWLVLRELLRQRGGKRNGRV